MSIIKGNNLANQILEQLQTKISDNNLSSKLGLAIILVGADPASKIYVEKKLATAQKLGIKGEIFKFASDTTTNDLIKKVKELNKDDSFNGIITQLPLPAQINTARVLRTIDIKKDVDGLCPCNIGKITLGDKTGVAGATPQGVMFLLKKNHITLMNQKVVLVGYGDTVGKLLAPLLIHAGATVTICTEFTKDLQKHTQRADIIITAVGQKHIISPNIIKDNAVIINIGCCKIEGKTYSDIDEQALNETKCLFTPTIGGVGPLTIAFLFKNLVEKCKT